MPPSSNQDSTYKLSYTIGWLVSALAIALIAPLLIPEESRSEHFWYRVAWTEALNLLCWGSAFVFLFISSVKNHSASRLGGVTPTISIVVGLYAALSFIVMVSLAFIPESVIPERIHWVVQIALFAITAILIIFLMVSRASETVGDVFESAISFTPKKLHDLLSIQEMALNKPESSQLRSSIKQLREILLYSITLNESLASNSEYELLCKEVEALCKQIETFNFESEPDLDQFNSLNDSTLRSVMRAKSISSQQLRK